MTDSSIDFGAPSTRRVVLAEDNPVTLGLMATWIERAGYEVHATTNGREALEAIDSHEPSIVVTDWQMPEMSGLELCRELRQRDERPYIYVLMVTSHEDQKDVIHAIDAGADDFLTKPLQEEDLLARVRQGEAALVRFHRFVEKAEHDPLTGAMNRRRFHEYCVRAIAHASRSGSHLSCALLDVDLFKNINDTYGHAAGDAALKAISDVIRRHTRDNDCLCRYGGDEFCILLPEMSEADAFGLADRLRGAIAELVVLAGNDEIEVRATLGVAQWRQNLITPRQLIDLADEALLAAKRSGRDCVVSYGGFNNLDRLEQTAGAFHDQFAQVLAGGIMTTPVVTLAQDRPMLEAGDLFLRLRINSIPIVDDRSRLVGILSEKDLLNSVSVDSNWERPVRDAMKRNVVSYDANTPATAIWQFLRRVTLRGVVIVDDGVPVGVISRGTFLRWLGNWVPLFARHERGDRFDHLRGLCGHVQAVASTIAAEAERLQQDVINESDKAVPAAVNAATRLQEQAQDLLSLSQMQYRFEPRRAPSQNGIPLTSVDGAISEWPCSEPIGS